MKNKDLLLYAISFLHSNIDDMVEEDLDMSEFQIESKLRNLLKVVDKSDI